VGLFVRGRSEYAERTVTLAVPPDVPLTGLEKRRQGAHTVRIGDGGAAVEEWQTVTLTHRHSDYSRPKE
jgi:hypothetical protein